MSYLYYEPDIECAPREVLHWIQSRRLVKMVEKCYQNVPLYRKRFDEMGLLPGDIKSIDDITKLPFTVKTDLRDTYPFGMFAVPKEELVRIHASSGTISMYPMVTACLPEGWACTTARKNWGLPLSRFLPVTPNAR